MKILIYGSTGMVGQGVLREVIQASDVHEIVCVGRSEIKSFSQKVKSITLENLNNHHLVSNELKDFDACFYCIGTSSMGKKEEQYKKVTYDLTMKIAETLKKNNPKLVFVYVCAKGSDTSEQGKVMWARVRGKLENSLFKLGFKQAYSMRPGYIQPMDGIKSRTAIYRILYDAIGFLYPVIKILTPNSVTSTREIGKAMLALARGEKSGNIINPDDINRLAEL